MSTVNMFLRPLIPRSTHLEQTNVELAPSLLAHLRRQVLLDTGNLLERCRSRGVEDLECPLIPVNNDRKVLPHQIDERDVEQNIQRMVKDLQVPRILRRQLACRVRERRANLHTEHMRAVGRLDEHDLVFVLEVKLADAVLENAEMEGFFALAEDGLRRRGVPVDLRDEVGAPETELGTTSGSSWTEDGGVGDGDGEGLLGGLEEVGVFAIPQRGRGDPDPERSRVL